MYHAAYITSNIDLWGNWKVKYHTRHTHIVTKHLSPSREILFDIYISRGMRASTKF